MLLFVFHRYWVCVCVFLSSLLIGCLLIYPKNMVTALSIARPMRHSFTRSFAREYSFLFNHLLLLLFLFRFKYTSSIRSKIFLLLRAHNTTSRVNERYADKEIKLVLWFYRMHTILNGYYMDFFWWIFIFRVFPCVRIVILETCFHSVSFTVSLLFRLGRFNLPF